MDERIPITVAAPWADSSVDGGGPISHADAARDLAGAQAESRR